MYVLQAFEISCHYLYATGNIAIDLAGDFDIRRIYQFICYLFHLLSYSNYMDGFDNVLTIPTHYPADLDLPEDLRPLGEQIILRGHMEANDVARMALVLDERLDDPELQLYHADGALMIRAQELRQLLGNQNPFDAHHSPDVSAALLRELLEDLHQVDSPYHAFADVLFPALLVPQLARSCQVPFCPREDCANDDEHWVRLDGDIEEFLAIERVPTELARCCGEEPEASCFSS